MADLVNLTIDGKAVQARPGTLVIDAARAAGILIPSFCYYPGLSLQGACRMCLVEVEKFTKLQTSCTLPVAAGMVVRTDTEVIHQARKSMVEFLLTNHPLDCPVCDKGGECELQEMAFRYGAGESRFLEVKHHVDEKQWSPVVFYDGPRCILCYRCVRICDEGIGASALGIVNRGVASEIAPNKGDRLECDECGACIDICPVGALTSGTYRYQTRPWEMQHAGTICTHCADGCTTTLGLRNGEIVRANNRDTSGINGEFLCVKGRYAFDFVGHPERLQTPLLRAGGKLQEVSWAQALKVVAAKFGEVKARGGKFGVVGSNHTTNEENAYLRNFTHEALGTDNIDHHRTGDVAALLDALRGRENALATVADLYTAKAALVIGADLAQQHPLLAYQLRANWRHHNLRLYAVTPEKVREDLYAVRSVRGLDYRGLREQLAAEPELVIVFGDDIQGGQVRELVAFGDSLGIPVKYVCLVDYANSRGAFDMGLVPVAGGLTVSGMLSAEDLDVLWVVGANPLKSGTLASTGAFVVVQDLFPTETAQRADVVLPAASLYEKSGSVTNVTGQEQQLKAAARCMGAKPDLEIFKLIARGMGVEIAVAAGAPPVPAQAVLPGIRSARDTLFTSGTLGRYSQMLSVLLERGG